jgi:two-component system, NtrC family, sensor kinase
MKSDFFADNELHTQIQYRLVEQLSESERRYRELVENLREIVFKCDVSGNITLLNKAWTFTLGYSTPECLNRPIDDYLHAEDRMLWLSFLNQLHNHQELVGQELRFHHKTAEIVWLELSAHFEEQGEICGSLTNITDRKRAQAALREVNEALQLRVEQLRVENWERKQTEATLLQSREQLELTLQELKRTHTQLIHAEKMSSLGQLVAGIAHEINNPVNFIHGNIVYANKYIQDLLNLLALYQKNYANPAPDIQDKIVEIDLNFLLEDLPQLFSSMQMGADRIQQIVLSLRNFSRLDEAEIKPVDIHEGIDSTLMILQSRLKEVEHQPIQVVKEYGNLPKVECYAGQLNQVFMNLLSNAIDAVVFRWKQEGIQEEKTLEGNYFTPRIQIHTGVVSDRNIAIRVIDNGIGMNEATKKQIFNPFFTTKPVGKGTGLGLSISYQMVVEKHGGILDCWSELGQGTEFLIQLPILLTNS